MRPQTTFQLLPVMLQDRTDPARTLSPRLPTEMELFGRQHAVIERSDALGLAVRNIGTMAQFDKHRVYPGRGRDWVLLNLADDPLLRDPDGFPMPQRVVNQVRRIAKSGIEFDGLYIAHEVAPHAVSEYTPVTIDTLTPPPPPQVMQLSKRLGLVGKVLWGMAAVPLAISGALTTAAAAAASAVARDPILLGVVVAPGRPFAPGELAALFYLDHWSFGQEV